MKKPIKMNTEKKLHLAPAGTGNELTVIDEAFKGILFAPVDNWLKTVEFLQQKQANNEKLIFEEEQILISYDTLKKMIINLHGNKGRFLDLPPLENTNNI